MNDSDKAEEVVHAIYDAVKMAFDKRVDATPVLNVLLGSVVEILASSGYTLDEAKRSITLQTIMLWNDREATNKAVAETGVN